MEYASGLGWRDLEVTPNADGGVLELGEQKLSLVRGETRRVKI